MKIIATILMFLFVGFFVSEDLIFKKRFSKKIRK
jgi:uncharacterized protein YneF (UPF0154 family)